MNASDAGHHSAAYTVRVVTKLADLVDLQPQWHLLAGTMPQPNVFASAAWNIAAWRHAVSPGSGTADLHVLVVECDRRVVAIAPFRRTQVKRLAVTIRKLEFIDSDLADYSDVVCGPEPDEAMATLAAHLAATRGEWDLLDLRNVSADAHWTGPFARGVRRAKLHRRVSPWDRCPYLPIRSTWLEHLATRSKSALSSFRRRQRRLSEIGDGSLRIRFIENPHAEPGLLERLRALDPVRGGTVTEGPLSEHPEFFAEVFKRLGPLGWLYVAVAEENNRVIAYDFGYRCGSKIWAYTGAFDEQYAQFALGTRLLAEVFDYGGTHTFDEFDFLRGAEDYKGKVTDLVRATHRLEAWSDTPRSIAAAALARAKRTLGSGTPTG